MSTPVHVILALKKETLEELGKGIAPARGRSFLTPKLMDQLMGALERIGMKVTGTETVGLGLEGWSKERGQYHTRAVLDLARKKAKAISDWHVKVLLITDADIYAQGTAFVAGHAEVDGRAAVVSFARLGAGDEQRFVQRVLKEALHELGHTIGLGHCDDHDCVMFASRVLSDSDVKDFDFCMRCRTKAGRALSVE